MRVTKAGFEWTTYAIYKYLTDNEWDAAKVAEFLGFDDVEWVELELMKFSEIINNMEGRPYVTPEMLGDFAVTDEQRAFYRDVFVHFESK